MYLQTELDKTLKVWSHKSKLTLYHLVKQLHCLTRLTLVVGGTHHEMRRERREDDYRLTATKTSEIVKKPKWRRETVTN